jgi:hypothetical protein
MCFVLYIGCKKEPSLIGFDPADRRIWIGEVDEFHKAARKHFSLQFVAYCGSDLNCGCGFRHSHFQQGAWPEEFLTDELNYQPEEGTQKNHDQLVAYIKEHFIGDGLIELYGCWDGEESEPHEAVEKISLEQTLDRRFHFKARVVYKVAV